MLFDLDGTLADTAPDLAAALNRVLRDHGRDTLPLEAVRPWASLGGAAMVRLGLGIDESHASFTAARDEFLRQYRAGIADRTVLFPGISELLAQLEDTGYQWGIVTNKLSSLTQPLLVELDLADRAECVVCGDTTGRPKPHPDPLLHACMLLDCRPAQAVYVGDDRRDVEAGHSAGTATVVATYGYIPSVERPETWGADHLIDHPRDLVQWLARSS